MILKRVLFVIWFPLVIILLIVNLSLLTSFHPQKLSDNKNNMHQIPIRYQPATSENTSQIITMNVIPADARTLLLYRFMSKYDSPMAKYVDNIVSEADTYGIDFRLVTAIAMCESNLGKRMPFKRAYNAWGLGVYTGETTGKEFDSWESAIRWVSSYIKSSYYDKGITNLKDIGSIWAPPSVENDFSWTKCVQTYMNMII